MCRPYNWLTGAASVCVIKVRQIPRTTSSGSNCRVEVILVEERQEEEKGMKIINYSCLG